MLTSLALIFLMGMGLGGLLSRLRLPSLLGMLLTGLLLGPALLDAIDVSILGISAELRQLALVIILTRAGLSLDLDALRKVGRPAVLMCFVPALCEIAGMVLLAPPLLGITRLEAAILGSVIAAVSPAVVVPRMLALLEQERGTKQGIPQLIMAGASVDDVFVIVLFTTFVSLEQGGRVSPLRFAGVPLAIALGIAAGLLVGVALAAAFRRVHIRDSAKVLILLSLSCLLVALEGALDGVVPFSGLLAVMAVGVALLRVYPVLAGRLAAKFSRLWVAAEVLLFVLVGASVDLSTLAGVGVTALLLVALALLLRMTGVVLCLAGTRLNARERLFCAVAYTPKATVQAAIGGIPLALGLACGDLVLAVAVLSILLTAPLGALGIDYGARHWLRAD